MDDNFLFFSPIDFLQPFDSLKVIQLKKSLKLVEVIDFNKIPNLEKLVLEGCINLKSLHPSIGVCKKLTFLNLKGCKNLKSLPRKFEIESLEILILSGCSNLRRIPEFGENMKSVSRLYLDGTAITKLPTSIGNLTGLTSLNLKSCKNLKSLPSKFEMEFLEILILSGCSNLKRIPEFGENMRSVSRLYLDGTAITKLPTSIGNLTSLASLSVKDCKNLRSLPTTFFNMKWLKDLNLSGCSRLLENLVIEKSVEEVDASGTSTGLMAYSRAFQTLKKLASDGLKPRNPNHVGLLSGLCCLTSLDLSYCNLNAIPNGICCLFSLQSLCLSGNNFSCLPESIAQLSNLICLAVDNCWSLRSWPKLPLNVVYFSRYGCILLEAVPDLFRTNCSKLAENQEFVDIYFAMIIKSLRLPLFGNFLKYGYGIVIPGSEIPKWFTHQRIGDEVSIQEPNSLLCNEWLGIAVCAVFFSHQILNQVSLACWLIVNGKKMHTALAMADFAALSDHIGLLYLLPQCYHKEDLKSLCECDANGFTQIGIKFGSEGYELPYITVKKCGLRMVCNKDIKDLKRIMAKRSENNTRIERLTEFMAQGNSNCEESSEYEECAEKLEIGRNVLKS